MRSKPILGYLLYLMGLGGVVVVAVGLAIADAARRIVRRG